MSEDREFSSNLQALSSSEPIPGRGIGRPTLNRGDDCCGPNYPGLMEIRGATFADRFLAILLDLKLTLSCSVYRMSVERQFELFLGTLPRRLASSLFTLALLSQLFVPCWTSASPRRTTPTCCQAHGKHRCAVRTSRSNSTNREAKKDDSLCSSPEKCPFRNLLVSHSFGKVALAHPSLWISVAVEFSRLSEVLFGFASPGFSSHTDRGPPLSEN
jgi:hypothetical protein